MSRPEVAATLYANPSNLLRFEYWRRPHHLTERLVVCSYAQRRPWVPKLKVFAVTVGGGNRVDIALS